VTVMTDSKSKKNQKDLRLQRNADILRRMRNGDPLNAVDSRASWFPPRPLVKKDLVEMARLYNTTVPPKDKKKWEIQNNIRLITENGTKGKVPEAG